MFRSVLPPPPGLGPRAGPPETKTSGRHTRPGASTIRYIDRRHPKGISSMEYITESDSIKLPGSDSAPSEMVRAQLRVCM